MRWYHALQLARWPLLARAVGCKPSPHTPREPQGTRRGASPRCSFLRPWAAVSHTGPADAGAPHRWLGGSANAPGVRPRGWATPWLNKRRQAQPHTPTSLEEYCPASHADARVHAPPAQPVRSAWVMGKSGGDRGAKFARGGPHLTAERGPQRVLQAVIRTVLPNHLPHSRCCASVQTFASPADRQPPAACSEAVTPMHANCNISPPRRPRDSILPAASALVVTFWCRAAGHPGGPVAMEPGLQALLKAHSALLEYDAALDKVRFIQSGHTMPAVARAVEQFVRCAWQRTSKCCGRCLGSQRNATC